MSLKNAKVCWPLFLLCGCVSYQDYPSAWASLDVSRQDCSAISGVYKNLGFWIEPERTKSHGNLIHRLTREFDLDDKLINRVEITLTDEDTLDVMAIYGEGESPQQPYGPQVKKQYFANKGEYSCNEGKIEIPYYTNIQIPFPTTNTTEDPKVRGVGLGTQTLMKANDGSLVIEDSGGGISLLFAVYYIYPAILPVAGIGSEWIRFEAYSQQSGANAPETIMEKPTAESIRAIAEAIVADDTESKGGKLSDADRAYHAKIHAFAEETIKDLGLE